MNSINRSGEMKHGLCQAVGTLVIAVVFLFFVPTAAQASSPGGGGGGIGEPPPPPREEVGGGEQGGGGNTDEPPPAGEEISGGTPGAGGEIPDDVVADVDAPGVLAYTVAPTVFFANGAQSTVITVQLSEVANVVLAITNNVAEQVFTETWEEVEEFELFWNGLDENNSPLPDGEYALSLTLSDAAGNTATVELGTVTIVSVRGLITDAYAQLQAQNDRSVRSTLSMLRTILNDRYWFDSNTLSTKGARSVTARLENAIRFLEKTEYMTATSQLKMGRENVAI
jgi:hypothetical protein